ncbi:MAG TPA: type II secretion system protein GspD [Xanthomonadales bacterium]|nr:type II secretion system protein GspD [Xanthomonadales bacterium]
MKDQLRTATLALLTAAVTTLAGCATTPLPTIKRDGLLGDAATTNDPASDRLDEGQTGYTPEIGSTVVGSGEMINSEVAAAEPPPPSAPGEATFNFEGDPLQAVIKTILGDLLQQNYVIAPEVSGTVTVNTPKPVNAAQAMSLLEMVLAWNNARLVWSDGRYAVVPIDRAIPGNLSPRTGAPASARGYELRAVPLRFISAMEMQKLLEPYARERAIVNIDPARNLIVLGGTRSELENYLRTIEIFDVDWLAGMSVGVFPLQAAEAIKVAEQLEDLFGQKSDSPLAGMLRFLPLDGINAVMVITPQPKYLRDIESWLQRIDRGGQGAALYVYELKHTKSSDLAQQLGQVFGISVNTGQDGGAGGRDPYQLQPGLDPVRVRDVNDPTTSPTPQPPVVGAGPGTGIGTGDGISIGGGDVSITAVEESNALLVRAAPSQWDAIRRAIERLDAMPLQVHIEAQVVEVSLKGNLNYGVNWFFENGITDATIRSLAEQRSALRHFGGAINATNGLGFTFVGNSTQAIVTALESHTDLRVLSAPSVVVRNNVQARLNTGTQIPVASTIINPDIGGTNNTLSQVQFRQTGVTLQVTPRVGRDGLVFMEIEQEVSSPSTGGVQVGGNVSVDTNTLNTEVAVQSGDTIMLAGMILQNREDSKSGLPFISRLPVLGSLFGNQSSETVRRELLIFITPTVIRNPLDARQLTDEYGERFRALDPLPKDLPPPKKHDER